MFFISLVITFFFWCCRRLQNRVWKHITRSHNTWTVIKTPAEVLVFPFQKMMGAHLQSQERQRKRSHGDFLCQSLWAPLLFWIIPLNPAVMSSQASTCFGRCVSHSSQFLSPQLSVEAATHAWQCFANRISSNCRGSEDYDWSHDICSSHLLHVPDPPSCLHYGNYKN